MRYQAEAYLQAGGDPTWLTDASKIPRKYKAINTLNILMAHCPWTMNVAHIGQLLKPHKYPQEYA